ncbi:MAG: glutathione synthase, partial [Bacteroidia bacterium]|nr:glutathione synthase [Bacteroidia bacterium]
VYNRPASLRDVNEKLYTNRFPDCCPPCIASSSANSIRKFLAEHQKIVIKPTHKMGGQSIYVIESGNLNTNVIIEDLTERGSKYVHVQKYIPDIMASGDKRIILINGKPVKYGIARIPSSDDHRGNMAVGAKPVGFELTDRDYWLCQQIENDLKRRGLFFVGLDIIGDYITEVNVTSPTGIREIDRIYDINIASYFFDALESNIPS